jgi:NADPH-dependent 2,4-dienoyl-CoA reductase/sulfur reductase-like enzyme
MSGVKRLLVVGGSDAGVMAAFRACQLDPSVRVTMVVADRYPNFSICGLPFYVSREVEDWRSLAHRTIDEITRHGVEILVEHIATRLDPKAKEVVVRDNSGRERRLSYDIIVIATGARPRTTDIEGIQQAGVYPLHTMEDSFAVRQRLDAGSIERAIIVGAGYIGLEMADAFVHRGLRVTLVSRTPTVMPTIDADLGVIVRRELERHGVEVLTGADVNEIAVRDGALEVHGSLGLRRQTDLVSSAQASSRTAISLGLQG